MSSVISVQQLAKSFGKHRVLENLSLDISEGEACGLVGLNGAGKTTLIRLLLGVLRADSGTVRVLGSDPWQHNTSLYRRLGVVLEHDGFWGNLTFEQNMKIFAEAKGVAWNEAIRYIEEFWGRTSLYKNKKAVKLFSRGQRMQCALCRAFLGWPSVYFFDEPAVALDVDAYDHFRNLVASARARAGSTRPAFLISSHQLDAIDDLCDRAVMLHDRQLAEIPRLAHGASGHELWSLATAGDDRWALVIREVCGSDADPVYHNGEWRFRVCRASETIPRLIGRLAEAGCSIGKVAPLKNEFSETIRSEYRKKASNDERLKQ